MKLDNFLLKREQIGGFEKISLINKYSKSTFSCIPGLDAMFSGLRLAHRNGVSSLIPSIDNLEDLNSARASYNGIILFPFPNRLNKGRYVHLGKEYNFPLNEVERSNNLHGVINKVFAIDKIDLEKGRLSLSYAHSQENAAYPFNVILEVEYSLSKNQLDVQLTVRNYSDEVIPVGLGGHPFFSFDTLVDALLMELPASQFVQVDDNLIPTNKLIKADRFSKLCKINEAELDNCFVVDSLSDCHIYSPKNNLHFYLKQDRNTLKYLHVYIPPTRDKIALEPVSCIPDAFNNGVGLIQLEPNGLVKTGYSILIA